jgi:hypothetical protein
MWNIVRPDLTVIQFYLNDRNVTYDHFSTGQIPGSIEAETVPRTAPAVSCLGALVR